MELYEAPFPAPEVDYRNYDHVAVTEAESVYLAKLGEWAKAQGAHPLAGKVVYQPYADSAAVYVIAKINGKVSLVTVDIGDGWRDHQFERLVTVAELKLRLA